MNCYVGKPRNRLYDPFDQLITPEIFCQTQGSMEVDVVMIRMKLSRPFNQNKEKTLT